MANNLQEQLNWIVERKNRATQLDNLIQGYRLHAQTEGKSQKTVRITTTAVTTFRDFLKANGFPTDVAEIGAQELREFILHLQQVKAFEHHPFTMTCPPKIGPGKMLDWDRLERGFYMARRAFTPELGAIREWVVPQLWSTWY